MDQQRKIPTIIGLLLIMGVVGVVIVLFENASRSQSRASGSEQPKNIQLTNISSTSFTVTWLTDSPATGTVRLSVSALRSTTAFDDRDTNGKLTSYQAHSVTVRSLSPNTNYSLKILSNGKSYGDNGKPLSVHTAPTIGKGSSGLEPAYGTIMTPSGSPANGALVYLTLEGGQLLSTITNTSGSWLITLNASRTIALDRYIAPADRITESIRVMTNEGEATATTDTLNDAPVSEMTLGKTYDFRKQQAGTKPSTLATSKESTPAILGAQKEQLKNQSSVVSIAMPVNGAAISTAFPLIQGTGIPTHTVSVVVGITNPVSGSTVVGTDGMWRFTPTRPLAPGKQSVTVTSLDGTNKPVAITHAFTVLKSGSQVLGDATPSATLEPTPTATPAATPTPEATLAAQPIPISGTALPTIMLIILGLGLLTSGAVVFIR